MLPEIPLPPGPGAAGAGPGHNRGMNEKVRYGSIGVVWLAAAVFAVLIGLLARETLYATWISLALAVCVLLGLIAQLATQQKIGFVNRLAASVAGAFVILGVTGAVLGIVAAAR